MTLSRGGSRSQSRCQILHNSLQLRCFGSHCLHPGSRNSRSIPRLGPSHRSKRSRFILPRPERVATVAMKMAAPSRSPYTSIDQTWLACESFLNQGHPSTGDKQNNGRQPCVKSGLVHPFVKRSHLMVVKFVDCRCCSRSLCLPSKGRTLLEGNIGRHQTLKIYTFNTHLSEGATCALGGSACNSGGSTYISGNSLV